MQKFPFLAPSHSPYYTCIFYRSTPSTTSTTDFFAFHCPSIKFLNTNCLFVCWCVKVLKCCRCFALFVALLCLLQISSLLQHTFHTTPAPIVIDHCNTLLTDWWPMSAHISLLDIFLYTYCYLLITPFILSIQGQLFCSIAFLPCMHMFPISWLEILLISEIFIDSSDR